MAATVRAAIRELLEQTMTTIETLLEASDRELPMPSSHGCAQGKLGPSRASNALALLIPV